MTPPPQFPALPPLASDTTTPRDAANDNNLLDFYNPDHAAAPKSIMHSENRNLIMSSASNRNSDRNSNKNSIGSSSTDNNSEAEEAVSKRPLPHPPTQSPPRGAGLRGKVCDSNNNINIDTDRNNGGSSISTSSTRQVEDSESEDDRARFRNRNQESAEEEEVSSIEDEQEGEQDEQGVSNITTILQQGERRQRRQRQRQEREDRARQNKLDRATARQLKYFDHMMVNLDVLVFAELAVLYYMEYVLISLRKKYKKKGNMFSLFRLPSTLSDTPFLPDEAFLFAIFFLFILMSSLSLSNTLLTRLVKKQSNNPDVPSSASFCGLSCTIFS